MQPISINLIKISSFAKEWITAVLPTLISDNFFIDPVFVKFRGYRRLFLTIFGVKFLIMASVRFYYADVRPIRVNKKRIVREFVGDIFSHEGKELKLLNYVFCSDSYLLTINKSFLKHDFFTDIISFDLSEGVGTVGEVYISLDRVKENSVIHSTTFSDELFRVIIHGALHLCGYRDKKKSEITLMRQKEDYYLRLLHEKIN